MCMGERARAARLGRPGIVFQIIDREKRLSIRACCEIWVLGSLVGWAAMYLVVALRKGDSPMPTRSASDSTRMDTLRARPAVAKQALAALLGMGVLCFAVGAFAQELAGPKSAGTDALLIAQLLEVGITPISEQGLAAERGRFEPLAAITIPSSNVPSVILWDEYRGRIGQPNSVQTNTQGSVSIGTRF